MFRFFVPKKFQKKERPLLIRHLSPRLDATLFCFAIFHFYVSVSETTSPCLFASYFCLFVCLFVSLFLCWFVKYLITSPSLCLSFCLYLFISLSLSLSHTHTHKHALSLSLSLFACYLLAMCV